jgi:hypothetical protein
MRALSLLHILQIGPGAYITIIRVNNNKKQQTTLLLDGAGTPKSEITLTLSPFQHFAVH